MLSFHSDPAIKEKYLSRVRKHRELDEIIKGKYWEGDRGCAVGCTIHSDSHTAYEDELGIPRLLARIEDRIFEGLPNELAMTWPERFLEAIAVGSDLSKVWPKFAIFILMDTTQCAARHPQCKIVADKYQEQLDGRVVDWEAASYATAADAAAYAAAAAASSYVSDAASDAASYAAAASSYAEREKAYIAQSEKLLELLMECK